MTPEQFVYWLQGFFELTDAEKLPAEQTRIIREHLKTVFKKETPEFKMPPSYGGISPFSVKIC